jgi:hypothetical protein
MICGQNEYALPLRVGTRFQPTDYRNDNPKRHPGAKHRECLGVGSGVMEGQLMNMARNTATETHSLRVHLLKAAACASAIRRRSAMPAPSRVKH